MFDRTLARFVNLQPVGFALTILSSLASALLLLAQAWLVSRAIDAVFLRGQTLAQITSWLALLLAVILLRAGTITAGDIAGNSVAARVKTYLRGALFKHLLALGPTYAQGQRTGELTSTLVAGIESLDAYFSQYLPQLVAAALVPLALLIFVFPLDWLSGLVLLVTAPLIPFFMILIGKSADALARKQFGLLSRLSAHFLDTLQGLTTLKLLNQSRSQANAIQRVSDDYATLTLRVLRVAFLSALVLEMVATISTAVVAVQVGLRLLYAQMEFQPALFILILAPEFYLPLRTLGLRFHAAASAVSASKRVFEILNEPLPTRSALVRDVALAAWHIEFRDVHFTYGDDRSALRGVSFTINAGETVALVGASGAGKSTVVQLLLRFIEPTHGEICVDGIPLREISADEWRKKISWVSQTPYLFNDTLASNIRIARPEASLDEIISAARAASLHEFVESLPQGYETPVGENAACLSGGQAQRLALARAFLKDAPISILDEPTTSLDLETEEHVRASIAQLMRGRTVLLIAHSLRTIATADKIVVLSHGQVVEAGSPARLSNIDGAYRKLMLAQGRAI